MCMCNELFLLKSFLYMYYRNAANESKSVMMEFFERVYNYYHKKELVSIFFLDLMHLHFDDLPETLKFLKNDEIHFKEFFQKKLDLTPSMYTIFEQVDKYLVQP